MLLSCSVWGTVTSRICRAASYLGWVLQLPCTLLMVNVVFLELESLSARIHQDTAQPNMLICNPKQVCSHRFQHRWVTTGALHSTPVTNH